MVTEGGTVPQPGAASSLSVHKAKFYNTCNRDTQPLQIGTQLSKRMSTLWLDIVPGS